MYKVLREIVDSFSLRELLRVDTPQNGNYYDLGSVAKAIRNPQTVALMESGQLLGYYGHDHREKALEETGSLRLPEYRETEVDGRIIRVKNVPATRTVAISLDGDVITHRQQILDTEPGRLVDSLESSNVGGWSWACVANSPAGRAIVSMFEGIDFVLRPNFLSTRRKAELPEDMRKSTRLAVPQTSTFNEPSLIFEDGGRTKSRIALPRNNGFAPRQVRYFG